MRVCQSSVFRAFVVVLIQAIAHGAPTGAAAAVTPPSFPAFMAATGLFVVTVVSWAPYVSDYSRYLPPTVNLRRTFMAVALGIGVPTILCACLGAYLTSLLPDATSTVAAIGEVSGRWVLPVMAVSLIGSDVVNSYTGMLAIASIVSCFRAVGRSVAVRVIGSLAIIAAGTLCALLGYQEFVDNLSNFLAVLLYVLIPWSAINLTDYYFIKRGDYDVPSFFTPRRPVPRLPVARAGRLPPRRRRPGPIHRTGLLHRPACGTARPRRHFLGRRWGGRRGLLAPRPPVDAQQLPQRRRTRTVTVSSAARR